MTREEAIRIFRKEIECLSHAKCEDCILEKVCDPAKTTPLDSEYIEAYGMAIQALSQEPTFDDECQKDMDEAWEQIQKKRKRIPVTLDLTPCDDAISREAVIEILGDYGCTNREGLIFKDIRALPPVNPQKSVIEDIKADLTNEANEHMAEGDYDDGVRFGLMLAEQIVCLHLGKAHKSGKWIPFSERLPKPFEHCLITTTDGEVIYHYDDGQYSKYKAWMPLPKPYEPQESEDKE